MARDARAPAGVPQAGDGAARNAGKAQEVRFQNTDHCIALIGRWGRSERAAPPARQSPIPPLTLMPGQGHSKICPL